MSQGTAIHRVFERARELQQAAPSKLSSTRLETRAYAEPEYDVPSKPVPMGTLFRDGQ